MPTFNAGKRICIGKDFAILEIKSLISSIILNYKIIPTKKIVEIKDNLGLPTKNGCWIKFEKRD